MEKDEDDMDLDTRCVQIKKLKEKVKSLVLDGGGGGDEFIYNNNGKIRHENDVNSALSESTAKSIEDYVGDESSKDEFIDFSEFDFGDERTWLFDAEVVAKNETETVEEICKLVYIDINDNNPDIKDVISELEIANKSSLYGSTWNQRIPIDSRTYKRPKKFTSRPSLNIEPSNREEETRTKLQRRLTTTILPSPNLIPKLEELSKVNNRPVSGNYSDVNWEDGAQEDLANVDNYKSKRRSIPASLFERLQELKRSNDPSVLAKVLEPNANGNVINGKTDDSEKENLMEDAKKVTAAFRFDATSSMSSSRISEIFKCPEYLSDDNESFINVDEMSSFCDRLTLSTDQSTYSSIVREMEKHEIYLSHRTSFEEVPENRLTFGGCEIPFRKDDDNRLQTSNDLNRTYELNFDNKSTDSKLNQTFEVKSESLKNCLNSTYDAEKKPGLVEVIMQSEILKNLSPKLNMNNQNGNEGNHILNSTYGKGNETFNKNEINAMHNEKYTTKIFDATFKKQSPPKQTENHESPPDNKNNGKKDSDHSEDDCMSTTSDNSYRSVESNTELKNIEDFKNAALEQNKRLAEKNISTPKCESYRISSRKSEEWPLFSPIRKDNGDAESQTSSNASSRGPSPRMYSTASAEGLVKPRPSSIRQPINKVPQRELKLKPALMRPTQHYKRTLNSLKTTSEPSVPQKVESCPNASCMPAFRPSVQPIVPSAMRPSSRTSGIPRPPSKLKPPQIRTSDDKKK